MVSNFIVQALLGEPITIYGDGSQTRSFCYVDDLIDGLMRLMASPDEVTGPINIGNPREFTILELAKMVIEITGSRSEIVQQAAAGRRSAGSASPTSQRRARCSAGSRRFRCKDGLERTVAYFRELLADEIRPAKEKLVVCEFTVKRSKPDNGLHGTSDSDGGGASLSLLSLQDFLVPRPAAQPGDLPARLVAAGRLVRLAQARRLHRARCLS